MAITDPTAVKFCNERIRPNADQYTGLYYYLQSLVNDWTATGMGSTIPVGGGAIEDGSHIDGRTPITADDVNLFVQQAQFLVDHLEANNNTFLNVVLKPHVTPR